MAKNRWLWLIANDWQSHQMIGLCLLTQPWVHHGPAAASSAGGACSWGTRWSPAAVCGSRWCSWSGPWRTRSPPRSPGLSWTRRWCSAAGAWDLADPGRRPACRSGPWDPAVLGGRGHRLALASWCRCSAFGFDLASFDLVDLRLSLQRTGYWLYMCYENMILGNNFLTNNSMKYYILKSYINVIWSEKNYS